LIARAAAPDARRSRAGPPHGFHRLPAIPAKQKKADAGRGLPARPCRSTACPPPKPRHGLQSFLTAFTARTRLRSPEGLSPFDGSLWPDEPLRRRQEPQARRASASDRSLRQRKHGDTVEAIAPDAAALRSRHVARRMDCGSSWTLLRITIVAVVDVGRAQVAARCAGGPPRVMLPTSVSPSLARCFAAIAP
jgi:hypothetical protein